LLIRSQNGKVARERNAVKRGSDNAAQMDSTARVGVFDLVLGSGTRRLNGLVMASFLFLRVFLPHGTLNRGKAFLPIGLLLSQASAIPHAEFMQRKLGVYG
jgi:hypothetical protein